MPTPIQFFKKNNQKLLNYCRRRWNGQGENVFWEATARSIEYEFMTHSLFTRLVLSAARDLKVSRWKHTSEGTVILPPLKQAKTQMKCEKCGGTKFADTFSHQKMCMLCGEKIDLPAPILDVNDQNNEDVDVEKLEQVRKNTVDSRVQAVFEAVLKGENLTDALKKAGISYHKFKKKAYQAYLQPSLFSIKNTTTDAYIYQQEGLWKQSMSC